MAIEENAHLGYETPLTSSMIKPKTAESIISRLDRWHYFIVIALLVRNNLLQLQKIKILPVVEQRHGQGGIARLYSHDLSPHCYC